MFICLERPQNLRNFIVWGSFKASVFGNFGREGGFLFPHGGVWSKICFWDCASFLTFAILIFGRISKQLFLSGMING